MPRPGILVFQLCAVLQPPVVAIRETWADVLHYTSRLEADDAKYFHIELNLEPDEERND